MFDICGKTSSNEMYARLGARAVNVVYARFSMAHPLGKYYLNA